MEDAIRPVLNLNLFCHVKRESTQLAELLDIPLMLRGVRSTSAIEPLPKKANPTTGDPDAKCTVVHNRYALTI